ncbi:MAG: ATP-dependent DNA helicase [Candidatus Wolfebacteria bacterium GW2011_GWA2_42_10]|uniref:ATP-dependent DNA helicase RecG n=2 Tax=Candidatus Wolfeibacteriota TaxID=1752735 RepID=A0A0G0XJH9_9BACT|nr:MAG: ATP-dependent DNA helicase [Candidatus Wolfebacteria bacterium GW2011_GWB1_41_12]KKS25054.1 MAG: ATP-dependent DNA helicase [Candidatus Wolfebacteria bacterium GW2011_GWA2_42_10]KKT56355.1 MAG: ATP-dependent DNA helicase [Candidatus Wolfebacteria bacterium GW2011_GWA1_44_24]
MDEIKLETPLEKIKGIGPKFLVKLKHFNIATVKDLLWHFPNRYEDFSNIFKIVDLQINQHATVRGEIQSIKMRRTWKRKMFIIEALISDDTGSIRAIWFNQKFLIMMLKKGKMVNLAGKVAEAPKGGLIMNHPIHEIITSSKENGDLRHTGRVVPIYPETKGITSKGIRYLLKPLLDKIGKIEESLPEEILKKYGVLGIDKAIKLVHFPEKIDDAILAKKRFAFEDLFFLSLANIRQRIKLDKEKAYSSDFELDDIKELLAKLPFELTFSQKKSLWEILQDIKKSHPMNRLLQGDVGSGKTIVAVLTALVLAKDGKQSAFMAPTEVLARQHFETFKKFFADFDKGAGLMTGSMAKVFYGDGLENDFKKNDLTKKVGNNEIKIVFGTHALIQKYVKFSDLALVIIDEQHRFGVRQRAELFKNHGAKEMLPHLLSMSATPIPRTLTLAVFGDLDLSIIDELPKNRKAIITKIVDPKNRDKAYAFIRGQVKKGRQVFVICPRIEPTSESQEIENQNTTESIKKSFFHNWDNVKMVKEEYEKLSKKVFPDLRVLMLHGKMKAKEKNETMTRFNNRETDILVSTSVIEVGVDVPNATIMMIEDADKFGLAQLYQFRGRVGRGEHQSFCFLLTESSSKITHERLKSLIDAKNGFELAEKDLAIRGPGEFLGTSAGWAQTGVPDMAMKAIKNPTLVKDSRKAAEELLSNDSELERYPIVRKRLESFQEEIHLE